jgi:hypothetical protein
MRFTILKNELEELLLEEETVQKKKQKIKYGSSSLHLTLPASCSLSANMMSCCFSVEPYCTASDHLTEEREKVDTKIQLLIEERDLIDQHLTSQHKKLEEVSVLTFSSILF